MNEQDELLVGVEKVFADVAKLEPKTHKNVIGDKWKFINAVVAFVKDREAKAKQHYKQKVREVIEGARLTDKELMVILEQHGYTSEKMAIVREAQLQAILKAIDKESSNV